MLKKVKGDIMNVKRSTIPSMKITKEEREENLRLLEETKKNQTKRAVMLPRGFSNFKKKTS